MGMADERGRSVMSRSQWVAIGNDRRRGCVGRHAVGGHRAIPTHCDDVARRSFPPPSKPFHRRSPQRGVVGSPRPSSLLLQNGQRSPKSRGTVRARESVRKGPGSGQRRQSARTVAAYALSGVGTGIATSDPIDVTRIGTEGFGDKQYRPLSGIPTRHDDRLDS